MRETSMSNRKRDGSRQGGIRWGQPLIIGITIAALLIGAQVGWDALSESALAADSDTVQDAPARYRDLPFEGTSLGDPDAPVTVEEYFDFRCPHCKVAASAIVDPLIERYVRSGKVRFTYRFFPILGPASITAARGGYCAALDDGFWPYQEILFDKQGAGLTAYSPDSLTEYASAIGLDGDAFKRCVTSQESYEAVARSFNEAQQLGLPGTPTFVVNGKVLQTLGLETLEAAIQRELEG